jgi:hypothetical protein
VAAAAEAKRRARLSRHRSTVLIAVAVALVTVALVLPARAGFGPFAYPAHPIPLREASVDESGRLLSVIGEYGDCDQFISAEVDERAAGVTVTVRMRHASGTCTMRLNVGAVTVRLDRPLGGRVVRDGGYGQQVALVDRDLRTGPRLVGAPQPYANP